MALRRPKATHDPGAEIIERVTRLVITSPVCARCLAFRLGGPELEMDEILQRIGGTVLFYAEVGRCHRCLRKKLVHRAA